MTPLPNYLRSHRQRLALSQEEVAFLLGLHGGPKISRDEHFVREPSLRTALAYEAIYQRPIRELFAGLYEQVEQDVTARAKTLNYRKDSKPSQLAAHKRQMLAELVSRQTNDQS